MSWAHHAEAPLLRCANVRGVYSDHPHRAPPVGQIISAKAESFFRTLKIEEVYLKDYRTFEEAEQNMGHFIGLQQEATTLQSRISATARIRGSACPEGQKLTMGAVREMGFAPSSESPIMLVCRCVMRVRVSGEDKGG